MDDERLELLAEVASLYYEEGLTQQEISNRLQYSRSRISRLLSEAQQEGVVEIHIHHPLARNRTLEAKLQAAFNLKEVRVCQNRDEPYGDMLQRIGAMGARLLAQNLRNNITIGFSWGAALAEVAKAFRPAQYQGIRTVQLIGTVGSVDPTIDGPGLVRRFAQMLDAQAFTLAAPWLIDNKIVRDALLEDRRLRETLELARQVDLAMVGIGSTIPELSALTRAGYLTPDQSKHLNASGIVGDVCGELFDTRGNLVEIPLAGYVFGINVALLRDVPLVIGVAGGSQKSSAILGSLRARLINALVTDESAAAAILERANAPEEPPRAEYMV
jgi:DNA-binding transcriptional regulator LsrR (DeoR family)